MNKHRARELRKNMTDAERLLWRHLRNRQLAGCKFRRQHPVEPFIVDFACLEKRIIIEVDGGQHTQSREADAERDAHLKLKGFKVIRFWNHQVLQETEAVLEVIRSYLL